MQISVILCTCNRHLYLRKVLDSIASSVVPAAVAWEVLVVDNNSSDQTQEVAKESAARYPGRIRYVLEPRQGKSHALNTGIRESRGGVLVFVDDDVTVEPAWLWNLTRALADGEWAGTGGRTLLAESFSPPRWLALSGPYRLEFVLAPLFDLGDGPCELKNPPYGANMAYRKEMFEKYGLFRTDMGPSSDPEIPRPNEDTEFGRRLMAAGERLRYEPSAIVYHPVHKNRIDKNYFLGWWFDHGRAGIREAGQRPDIWGIQRRYWSLAKITGVVLTVRALRWMLAMNPSKRFYCKCLVWATAGQIAEVYRHWGPLKTPTAGAEEDRNAVCKARS
ncbi:MAG: glycosyltransferase [Candidatus Sulfotelmatobacter sp.]